MKDGVPCAPAYTLELTCDVCRGACCDFDASTCAEDVTEDACSGANVTWHPDLSCSESGCIGACCDPSMSMCTDVFSNLCQGPGEEWVAATQCCEVECRYRGPICVGGADDGWPCNDDGDCTPPGICDPAGLEFDSSGVELLSNIPVADFPGAQTRANEMWGYVSPSGGEYAIIGFHKGTAFVNVDVPTNPIIIGYIDGLVDTVPRDMSTFGNHAYLTAGAGIMGLQIVDLTNIDSGVVTLVNTTNLGVGYGEAHNLHINPDSGFLYFAVPNLNSGEGLTVVDLNTDPVNPTVAGTWTDTDPNVRCHDVHVASYTTGPNAGKEIAFCPAENDGLKIVDVTDKGNMFTLSTLVYPNTTYAHQTRLSDDGKFVFLGDEIDEREDPDVTDTTTYVINVSDLSNPTLQATFTNGLCAVDHNMMVRGNYLFEANYSSGMRVFNVCDVNNVVEIGHFDTRPEDNVQDYLGAWGVYTQLPSGVVLVSDRERGLFVLDVSAALAAADTDGDGTPDNCEGPADCNDNEIDDAEDIAGSTSQDCNINGIPDECEIDQSSPAPNGPFFCDPASPPEGLDQCDPDCNGNGVPDECEPDSDGDGIPNACDDCPKLNCDDGIACTTDTCDDPGTGCVNTPVHAVCDDGNVCTADTCDTSLGCQSTALSDGTACDDGEFCTVQDVCTGGVCGGSPRDCSDGLFCNGEEACVFEVCISGIPPCPGACDEQNDSCLSPLGLPANPKHHARKHRYLSVDATTNLPGEISIKVEIAEMNRCQGDLRRSCIDDTDCPTVCQLEPDLHSCGDGSPCSNGVCVPTAPCGPHPDVGLSWFVQEPQTRGANCPNGMCDEEDYYARVDAAVYGSDWDDECEDAHIPEWTGGCATLHIGDCEIVPGVKYNVYACDPVAGDPCSDPLPVETTRKSELMPHYGDTVGVVDPANLCCYSPPDGYTNVHDVSAYQRTKQNWGTTNSPQAHPTWIAVHGASSPAGQGIPPNYILGVEDLFMILRAWVDIWPYENTLGGLAPGGCP